MPPKKKIKLKLDTNCSPADPQPSTDPQSSAETDDRAARREARLAARRSAREDFDPPFDINDEDKTEGDEDKDEDDIDQENRDTDEGSEPESDIQASTRTNTFLNTGFKTAEGQLVAQENPGNIPDPTHLAILARGNQDIPEDQDAPAESVELAE